MSLMHGCVWLSNAVYSLQTFDASGYGALQNFCMQCLPVVVQLSKSRCVVEHSVVEQQRGVVEQALTYGLTTCELCCDEIEQVISIAT